MVTILQVTAVLHPIGITCASLILVILFVFSIYDKNLVNRVTLRLIAVVALADIFTHTKDYLIKNHRTNDNICIFISAFTYFSTYLYCFTNIAVAYNFQRTFIQMKISTIKFELLTWVLVITVSLLIIIIFWLLGTFGFDPIQRKCVGISGNWVFYLRGHFQWILCSFTTIYCVWVTLVILWKLNDRVNIYLHSKIFDVDREHKHRKAITKLIRRCMLYPLSPIVTQPPMIAYITYYMLYSNTTDEIQWWLGIGYGLSGILTFIAFCMDATLQKAVKIVYNKFRPGTNDIRHLNSYEFTTLPHYDVLNKVNPNESLFKTDKEFLFLTREL